MNRKRISIVFPLIALCMTAGPGFAQFDQPFKPPATPAPQDILTVSGHWSTNAGHPGGRIVLAVTVDIAKPYHINAHHVDPNKQIPTTVELKAQPPGLTSFPAQYPAGISKKFEWADQPFSYYYGNPIFYLPIEIADNLKPGDYPLTVAMEYQACDETSCLMPVTKTLTIQLKVVDTQTPIQLTDAQLFKDFNPAAFNQTQQATQPAPPMDTATEFDLLGFGFNLSGTIPILLIAFAVGALLNFTPCVLPVVPIKVMSLQQHAQHPGKLLVLGVAFSVGIIACFGVLGAMIALLGMQWGEQFSQWWFTAAIGLICLVMALGMFNVFAVQLPQAVYMVSPRHDTLTGSFGFGVLTAILSTPCTAPMFTGTAAWATRQPPWLSLSAFLIMGLGMATPYMLLLIHPKWIDYLPRAGRGSEVLKQVLGLLLLAVAAYLFGAAGYGVLWGKIYLWLVAIIITIAMIWLSIGTFLATDKISRRLFWPAIAVLLTVAAWYAMNGLVYSPIQWHPWSPQAVADGQQAGKTIVIEFTAEWCLNCKTLEAQVLQKPSIVAALDDPNVLPLKVDLTHDNPQGRKLLQSYGGSGIPFTVILHPNTDKPIRLPSLYTPGTLLKALKGPDPS